MAENKLNNEDHDALVRIEVTQSRMADDVRELTEIVKTTNKNHEDRLLALEAWRRDHATQRRFIATLAAVAATLITASYELTNFVKNVHR